MLYRLDTREPWLDEGVYLAPSACVIGDVKLYRRASVWFGAILRGDNESIVVGTGSNIQDNAVLHADPGFPLSLEENVTVGHMALLHGCSVGAGRLIGIGAVVLNGARIGRDCLIAAKTLVPEGKVIPDGSVVRGIPACLIGEVSDRHVAMMRTATASYLGRAERYAAQLVEVRSVQQRTIQGSIEWTREICSSSRSRCRCFVQCSSVVRRRFAAHWLGCAPAIRSGLRRKRGRS